MADFGMANATAPPWGATQITLDVSLRVFAGFSLALSVLLSLFYAAFKRGFPHVGVLGFALSTFGLSTALLIGPAAGYEALEASVPLCQSQGFLIQFFALACVIYYLGIVLTLFVVVMLKDLEGSHKVTRFLYYGQHALLLAAFLVALLSLELGEFGVGSYGFRGMWCWVAGNQPWLEIAYFYGPMMFVCVVTLVCWLRLYVHDRRAFWVQGLKRHLLFAIVFFLLFTAMFTHRLFNAIAGTDTFVLIELHIIALGGFGTWLFLVFGVTGKNAVILRQWIEARRRGYVQLNR